MNRKIGLLVAALVVAPTLGAQDSKVLRDFVDTLSKQVEARAATPVAVVDFGSPKCGNAFGIFLTGRISSLLVQSNRRFDVVTRNRVDDAFREINLSLGQNYDAATFAKIGKAVGAKAIIRGSYTPLPSAGIISINAEIVDVATLRLLGAATAELPFSEDSKAMLHGCTTEKSDPAESNSEQVVPTRGFVFRLQRCAVSKTEVTCKIQVTSPERDRTIEFGHSWDQNHTLLFDQNGNSFERSQVAVANKRNDDFVKAFLVRDIAVAGEVSFSVNSDVRTISLLQLGFFDVDSGQQFNVEFRNVTPAAR